MAKKVRDAMTSQPRAAEPNLSLVEAARLMKEEDVGSLPVVEGGRLVAMLTDRDIVIRAVAEARSPDSTTVDEVATRDVVTAQPDDDLDEALMLMARRQVRRLPIVEGERLVGILAQADIAQEATPEQTGEVLEEISRPS